MPSSRPHTPHSQPQASTPTNTATGFMLLALLVSQGTIRLPEMVWMTSEAPATARAMLISPNCTKPTSAGRARDHGGTDVGHQVQDRRGDAPDRGVLEPEAQNASPVATPTTMLGSSCTSR